MSPRSQSSPNTHQPPSTTPDHEAKPTTTTNPDDDSSTEQEEARPPHTAEIGTLKKLSVPGGTAWLGSSSGVYFVNTVRRAFSAAFASTSPDLDGDSSVPASEDIITGEDAAGHNVNGLPASQHAARYGAGNYEPDSFRRIITSVGRPPADRKLAMDLVTTFFRQTHPLFPFLHGPRFLEDMNEIYTAMSQMPKSPQKHSHPQSTTSSRKSSTTPTISPESSLGNLASIDPLKLITFQIIINIAALSQTQGTLIPSQSTIPSAHSLLTLILPLSTTPLLPTIQLLLAAELYLLSTISLRHSSTLAGLVLRLIYHTGLHRCPLRYASLTPQDCEIRKRVFWSAYALDRHLSLALGDPNTFQDSDIDVCLSRSGEGEMHRAVARDLLDDSERGEEWRMHFPRDASGRLMTAEEKARTTAATSGRDTTQVVRTNSTVSMTDASSSFVEGSISGRDGPSSKDKPVMIMDDDPRTSHAISNRTQQLREAALTAYVHYGKLTGRIIEIFHKSINFRFPKQDAIGYLTADIENWWNDLPSTLTGEYNPSTSGEGEEAIDPGLVQQHKLLTPFFTLLYHQLLLLLNRPRLSLDQGTAEFQQGLQVCIRASRNTLSALKKHRENGQSMFLPGLLSAAWMSGLIIAFACQLGKYPKTRACSDIKSCLLILESMNVKWYTVKNCHKVLSLLLANITSRKANSSGYLTAGRNDSTPTNVSQAGSAAQTRKRTRDSIMMDTGSEAEPSPKRDSLAGVSPASSDFRPPSHFRSPDMRPNVSNTSNSSAQAQNPGSRDFPSSHIFSRQDSAMSTSSFDFGPNNQVAGSAMGSGINFNNLTSNGGLNNNNMSDGTNKHQRRAGAALYADPQDMAFAQSSHSMGLPEMSSSMDDQMFWGNIDSNLFDVFGAVSWETMTGPVGPMVSNPNAWDMSAYANAGGGNTNGNDPQASGKYL
ncbi:hypothetical protein H2198_002162 [Neophaeococcomyces mojaviensis]|uniref:Uncharacterized protein n=1 Tax=Neophaeococcomyces mojaviensis TaxID=3383035 RepID=A0ACC3AER9_9EURO|nr:hypothetical protein H2198_002162 [Knufia sp. JES_112]